MMTTKAAVIVGILLAMAMHMCKAQAVCAGTFTVQSEFDLTRLVNCQSVLGTVVVQNMATLDTLSLPNLKSISSSTNADGNNTSGAGSGSLIIAHNPLLRVVDLPMLESVQGELMIYDNAMLEQIGMAAVQRIDSHLLITANSVNLMTRAIEQQQPQQSLNGTVQSSVNLTQLATVGGNATLTNVRSLDLASLRTVAGNIVLTQTLLQSVSLPALTSTDNTGTISVLFNPQLEHVQMPQLQSVSGNLVVEFCPRWVGFLAGDLQRLQQVAGSIVISSFDPRDVNSTLTTTDTYPTTTNSNNNNAPVALTQLDFGPQLVTVRGGMFIRSAPLANESSPLTCQQLSGQYADGTGIVQGPFLCVIQGRDSVGVSSATKSATVLIMLMALTVYVAA